MDQSTAGMETTTSSSDAAASRQKSCNACVKSKRRCDKTMPICSRCAERGEACVYKRRRLNKDKSAALLRPPQELGLEGGLIQAAAVVDLGSQQQSGLGTGSIDNLNSAEETPQQTFFPFSALFSPLEFDFFELPAAATNNNNNPGSSDTVVAHACGDGISGADISPGDPDTLMNLFMGQGDSSSSSSLWLTHGQQRGNEIERVGTPIDDEVHESYGRMGDLCTPYQPWTLYDTTTRVHHIHAHILSFPRSFALTSSTPFLHRHIYKTTTPACITAVFGTSVMYTNRTEANKGMVYRALQADLDKLLGGGMDGMGTGTGTGTIISPYEKLARVHALFLYQVIRLFDGDVCLRGQGERDLPVLERWLGELCRVRDNLGGGGGDDSKGGRSIAAGDKRSGRIREVQAPDSWERWIFAESVRRTIFMAYSVLTIYELMKGTCNEADTNNVDDLGPWAYVYRWTMSRHLWEAENSYSFYRAWEEKKPHFIIESYSLDDFLQYGRPDDVDDFGEIVLKAYVGHDATMEFLSGRSNTAAAT